MSRKRKIEECVENYFYEIVSLGKEINLTDNAIMRYIISGLDNEHLKGVLIASKCNNLHELLQQIKTYEAVNSQVENRNKISKVSKKIRTTRHIDSPHTTIQNEPIL